MEAGIRPKAPPTINRETQLLRQAFTLEIERRHIVTAPHVRHLPERNVRQGFFEKADCVRLLEACEKQPKSIRPYNRLSPWRIIDSGRFSQRARACDEVA